mmetsp:Transcript_13769/g.25978  ORF Transcript_13769/g.25978 Transcript_13769/m.25978 type:complete len:90 (+) Transcript_13769:1908-2177(+)
MIVSISKEFFIYFRGFLEAFPVWYGILLLQKHIATVVKGSSKGLGKILQSPASIMHWTLVFCALQGQHQITRGKALETNLEYFDRLQFC